MFDVCYLNKRQGSYKGSALAGIRIWKKLKISLIPLHEVRAACFVSLRTLDLYGHFSIREVASKD